MASDAVEGYDAGFGGIFGMTKGLLVGVCGGIICGLIAEQLKDKVPYPIGKKVLSPAVASVTAILMYGMFS